MAVNGVYRKNQQDRTCCPGASQTGRFTGAHRGTGGCRAQGLSRARGAMLTPLRPSGRLGAGACGQTGRVRRPWRVLAVQLSRQPCAAFRAPFSFHRAML